MHKNKKSIAEDPITYYESIDDKSIYFTFFHLYFLISIIISIIVYLIFSIMSITLLIVEYNFFNELINIIPMIILQGFSIFLSFYFCLFSLFLGPFLEIFRIKSNLITISKCKYEIYPNKINIIFDWPIYSIPFFPLFHKRIVNKVPLNNIKKIIILSESKDNHNSSFIKKVIPWTYYRKPGLMHLSGINKNEILKIELLKEMDIVMMNMAKSPLFGPPKPKRTKSIYIHLNKNDWGNFFTLINKYSNKKLCK